MDNYYDITSHVSNSKLTELKMWLNGLSFGDNMQPIFDFGNLIDGMLTEKEKLNFVYKTMKSEHGRIVQFTDEEWQRALNMRRDGLSNPILKMLVDNFDSQSVIMLDEFKIEGVEFNIVLPVRCKFDFLKQEWKMGADLKSTACTTQTAFLASLYHLDYDRQAAWYMDLASLDKFTFVGICKTPNKKGKHDIFVHALERGDEMYLSGKAKYQHLAIQYYFLIH